MDETLASALKQKHRLFVITSASFVETQPKDFEAELNALLPGRVHVIPNGVTHPLVAADGMRSALNAALPVDGVVILGNYLQVPSHTYKCVDPDLYAQMVKEGKNPDHDPDHWWAWNDDIYGCLNNTSSLPHLPVSRLPFIPKRFGAPYVPIPSPKVYGLRTSGFPCVEHVFGTYLAPSLGPAAAGGMDASPPLERVDATAVATMAGSAGADVVYLVLHGTSARFSLMGGNGNGPEVVVEASVAPMVGPGSAVFGGVCYGALAANKPAKTFKENPAVPSDPLLSRSPTDLAAMSMLNQGANAFVGFSCEHHLPHGWTTELILGAPLHHYFWQNVIDEDMPPAQALFMAKAKTVMSLDPVNTDSLALAQTLKAVWSATCLGLGW